METTKKPKKSQDITFDTMMDTSEAEVKQMFVQARKASDRLRKSSIETRLEALHKLIDVIVRDKESIIDQLTAETQKCRTDALVSEVLGILDNFEWLERNCSERSCLEGKASKLVRGFMKSFRQAWGVGYQKDGRNPLLRDRWRDFHVLLTGGGARRPEIEREIRNALPMCPWPVGEKRYQVCWHEPTGIDLGTPDDSQSTALLAVAHGLSVPRQQWPVFFVPGEVETREAPEVIEQPPAFWYID